MSGAALKDIIVIRRVKKGQIYYREDIDETLTSLSITFTINGKRNEHNAEGSLCASKGTLTINGGHSDIDKAMKVYLSHVNNKPVDDINLREMPSKSRESLRQGFRKVLRTKTRKHLKMHPEG